MPTDDQPPPWLIHERRRVGDRVRQLRMARQMTQEGLAERAALDPKTINRIEGGRYSTSIDNLLRIARALGVPARALFE